MKRSPLWPPEERECQPFGGAPQVAVEDAVDALGCADFRREEQTALFSHMIHHVLIVEQTADALGSTGQTVIVHIASNLALRHIDALDGSIPCIIIITGSMLFSQEHHLFNAAQLVQVLQQVLIVGRGPVRTFPDRLLHLPAEQP